MFTSVPPKNIGELPPHNMVKRPRKKDSTRRGHRHENLKSKKQKL
jgi:hypothetical protein